MADAEHPQPFTAFTDEDRASLAGLKTLDEARGKASQYLSIAKDNGAVALAALEENERLKAAPQKFFADFAAEMRRPSFGEMQAGFMRTLLLRAQEAKLYTPPENP